MISEERIEALAVQFWTDSAARNLDVLLREILTTAAQEAAAEQARKDATICQDKEDCERDGLNVAAYRSACQDLTVKILAQIPPTNAEV